MTQLVNKQRFEFFFLHFSIDLYLWTLKILTSKSRLDMTLSIFQCGPNRLPYKLKAFVWQFLFSDVLCITLQ